jgi:hypothetical protein
VSFTYDGCLIVSDNFRVAAKRFAGAVYTPLPSQRGWFRLSVEQSVTFDIERRRTRFTKWCDECERWTQIAGATPVMLVDPPCPLPDQFLRTDQVFGSNDEQHPLTLIGPGVAQALSNARLRGLELEPIEHPYKAK